MTSYGQQSKSWGHSRTKMQHLSKLFKFKNLENIKNMKIAMTTRFRMEGQTWNISVLKLKRRRWARFERMTFRFLSAFLLHKKLLSSTKKCRRVVIWKKVYKICQKLSKHLRVILRIRGTFVPQWTNWLYLN